MTDQCDEGARVAELLAFVRKAKQKKLKQVSCGITRVDSPKLNKLILNRVNPPSPKRPDPADCCGSGCTPCVYDAYNDELETHKQTLQKVDLAWKERCLAVQQTFPDSEINEQSITIPIQDEHLLVAHPLLQPSIIHNGSQIDPLNTQEPALSPKEYRPFLVSEIILLPSETKPSLITRGKIPPDSKQTPRRWDIDVGQHVQIQYTNSTGEKITRSFTPTTHPHAFGEFEFHLRLYPGGVLSEYFSKSLRMGDSLWVRGPISSGFSYTPGQYNSVFLLAGGSGITPLYQLLLKIEARQPVYPTRTLLIYSTSTSEDVWLREPLTEMAKRSRKSLIQVVFWSTSTHGRLNAQNLSSILSGDHASFELGVVCGPPTFEASMRSCITNLVTDLVCLSEDYR